MNINDQCLLLLYTFFIDLTFISYFFHVKFQDKVVLWVEVNDLAQSHTILRKYEKLTGSEFSEVLNDQAIKQRRKYFLCTRKEY